MKQVYFVPNRCMGCEECVIACEKAHGGESRAYLQVVGGFFPYPMRCNHCADAPCKAVCPAQAISRTGEGMVVVDLANCIGCGTCVVVCPFGVPRISQQTHKVVKCDGCVDRVAAGEVPVCVAACAKGALEFGEYTEQLESRRLRRASAVKAALASGSAQ